MKCPQCRIVEMMVEKIEDNIVTYKCKKCGKVITEPLQEQVINVESE